MPATAAERCAEMVLRAMRASSPRLAEHYLTAARFFALVAEPK